MYFRTANPLDREEFLAVYRESVLLTQLLFAPYGLHEDVSELLGERASVELYTAIFQQFEDIVSKKLFIAKNYEDDRIIASMSKYVGSDHQDQEIVREMQAVQKALQNMLKPPSVVQFEPLSIFWESNKCRDQSVIINSIKTSSLGCSSAKSTQESASDAGLAESSFIVARKELQKAMHSINFVQASTAALLLDRVTASLRLVVVQDNLNTSKGGIPGSGSQSEVVAVGTTSATRNSVDQVLAERFGIRVSSREANPSCLFRAISQQANLTTGSHSSPTLAETSDTQTQFKSHAPGSGGQAMTLVESIECVRRSLSAVPVRDLLQAVAAAAPTSSREVRDALDLLPEGTDSSSISQPLVSFTLQQYHCLLDLFGSSPEVVAVVQKHVKIETSTNCTAAAAGGTAATAAGDSGAMGMVHGDLGVPALRRGEVLGKLNLSMVPIVSHISQLSTKLASVSAALAKAGRSTHFDNAYAGVQGDESDADGGAAVNTDESGGPEIYAPNHDVDNNDSADAEAIQVDGEEVLATEVERRAVLMEEALEFALMAVQRKREAQDAGAIGDFGAARGLLTEGLLDTLLAGESISVNDDADVDDNDVEDGDTDSKRKDDGDGEGRRKKRSRSVKSAGKILPVQYEVVLICERALYSIQDGDLAAGLKDVASALALDPLCSAAYSLRAQLLQQVAQQAASSDTAREEKRQLKLKHQEQKLAARKLKQKQKNNDAGRREQRENNDLDGGGEVEQNDDDDNDDDDEEEEEWENDDDDDEEDGDDPFGSFGDILCQLLPSGGDSSDSILGQSNELHCTAAEQREHRKMTILQQAAEDALLAFLLDGGTDLALAAAAEEAAREMSRPHAKQIFQDRRRLRQDQHQQGQGEVETEAASAQISASSAATVPTAAPAPTTAAEEGNYLKLLHYSAISAAAVVGANSSTSSPSPFSSPAKTHPARDTTVTDLTGTGSRSGDTAGTGSMTGAGTGRDNFPRSWLLGSYLNAYEQLSAAMGLYYERHGGAPAVSSRHHTSVRDMTHAAATTTDVPVGDATGTVNAHDIDVDIDESVAHTDGNTDVAAELPFPPIHLLAAAKRSVERDDDSGTAGAGVDTSPCSPEQAEPGSQSAGAAEEEGFELHELDRAAYALLLVLVEALESVALEDGSTLAAIAPSSSSEVLRDLAAEMHALDISAGVPLNVGVVATEAAVEAATIPITVCSSFQGLGLPDTDLLQLVDQGVCTVKSDVLPAASLSLTGAHSADTATATATDGASVSPPAISGDFPWQSQQGTTAVGPCPVYQAVLCCLRGNFPTQRHMDAGDSFTPAPQLVAFVSSLTQAEVQALTGVDFSADGSVVSIQAERNCPLPPPKEEKEQQEEEEQQQQPEQRRLSSRLRARLLSICGSVAYLAGDAEGAVRCLRASVRQDPLLLDSQVKLGSLLVDMDEPDQARSLLETALQQQQQQRKEEEDSSAVTMLHLSELEINRSRFDDAVDYLRRARRLTDRSLLSGGSFQPTEVDVAAAHYRAVDVGVAALGTHGRLLRAVVARCGICTDAAADTAALAAAAAGTAGSSSPSTGEGASPSKQANVNANAKQETEEQRKRYCARAVRSQKELVANIFSLLGIALFREHPSSPEVALGSLRGAVNTFARLTSKKHDSTRIDDEFNHHDDDASSDDSSKANAILLVCCGEVYSQAGDVVNALDCFRRAHAAAPLNPLPFINAARTYQQLGQLHTAKQHLCAALRLDGSMAMVRVDLAQNSLLGGNAAPALGLLDEALQLALQVSEIKDVLTARTIALMQLQFERRGLYTPPYAATVATATSTA